MKGPEYEVCKMVVNYIQTNWPTVEYRVDLGGLYTGAGWGLAKKIKDIQKDRAWPDLVIAYPTLYYASLYIELKADHSEILTQDGQWRQGDSYQHIYEQRTKLQVLRAAGYCAEFGCGFEHTRDLIDWYMSLPEFEPVSGPQFPQSIVTDGIYGFFIHKGDSL